MLTPRTQTVKKQTESFAMAIIMRIFGLYTTTFHEKPTTMIGKVKWFDSKKGYGFILNEEGREIFVHYTGIVADGFKALAEGQNVEFEIEKNDKGEQAVNVTVLHKKQQ